MKQALWKALLAAGTLPVCPTAPGPSPGALRDREVSGKGQCWEGRQGAATEGGPGLGPESTHMG